MHNYQIPEYVSQRVFQRRGDAKVRIDGSTTALVVIDMQNYFVDEAFSPQAKFARAIIPAVNRAAQTVRAQGGKVVWIQTTATGALEFWGRHHEEGMSPASVQRRLTGLDEKGEGFKLYPGLDAQASDIFVKKIKFSALAPDSSQLDKALKQAGMDTVLIAGTVTNVCCESTARDAMMLNYKTIMLSDANAALSDEEHAAALNTFHNFFGYVMNVAELESALS